MQNSDFWDGNWLSTVMDVIRELTIVMYTIPTHDNIIYVTHKIK